jgi:hypothetical protein
MVWRGLNCGVRCRLEASESALHSIESRMISLKADFLDCLIGNF